MNTHVPRSPLLSRLTFLLLLAVLPAMAAAGEMQAWLMYNPSSSETLMTTDFLEKSHLAQGGWKVSGSGILQSEGGTDTAPLVRMVRATDKGIFRMLVTDPEEVSAKLKAGFVTEGTLGYVAVKTAVGLIPVCRFSKAGTFIWLSSAADQKWAETNGWKREPNKFWLWPTNYR